MKTGLSLARPFKAAILLILTMSVYGCKDRLKEDFRSPPTEFRPMPLWHLNGRLTRSGILCQIAEAKEKSGYGGMTVLPVSAHRHWHDGQMCPGMTPEFLGEEYFGLYGYMLKVSDSLDQQIILYDDIDFPTGSAGGRLLKEYPEYCRKYLEKEEFDTKGGCVVSHKFEPGRTQSWIALSAMNTATREVVDLQPFLTGNELCWTAPEGEWKVMAFFIRHDVGPPHGHLVDYMDPLAVAKVMEMTYGEYDRRFGRYFGNVIRKTFFDDIGFVHMEQTWNKAISDHFRRATGRNASLYYPALFYDIGPATRAARVAFHNARAELMAEGYVGSVSEWAARRGLKSMGHPPENYSPNTVVTCGDVLKFYRHVQIPLLDVIFRYGRGRDGYKQITSAADRGDKELVGAELNGAFAENMDSLDLYRVAMESMARGVNFIVPHGLWYDTDPARIRIPPLISWDNPDWGEAVPRYSQFTSRSCVMLQGGRRVVDVAMLWPIQAVQAESWIYRDNDSFLAGGQLASWLPDDVMNYRISGILTDSLKRDFTYLHPEDFINGKVIASGDELILDNRINRQNYKVLIMPGGAVLAVETMRAIKAYYEGGGKVLATVSLPSASAEIGRDEEIVSMIDGIFGTRPVEETVAVNGNGGIFAFIPTASADQLGAMFDRMGLSPDVAFDESSTAPPGKGCVNYTHKQKDGREIYYFINTTDSLLSTAVILRGRIKNPETWDPHTGRIAKAEVMEHGVYPDGVKFTRIKLSLKPSMSIFVVARI